jgi:hypothetical protein
MFHNRSESPLFAMAGELFVGGRQDRVLNRSVVLEPGARVEVPVSCVEAGRWHTRSGRESFAAGGVTACASVRSTVQSTRVTQLMSMGVEGSHQTRIWSQISRTLCQTGTAQSNNTQTLAGAMYSHRKRLNEFAKRFRPVGRQVGWAFFAPGRRGPVLLGADGFGTHELLKHYSRRILRGVAMETRESSRPELSQAMQALQATRSLLRSLASHGPLKTQSDPGRSPHTACLPGTAFGSDSDSGSGFAFGSGSAFGSAGRPSSSAAGWCKEQHYRVSTGDSAGVVTLLLYRDHPVHLAVSPDHGD